MLVHLLSSTFVHLHFVLACVDIGDVVFGPAWNDSREKYCAVRMVATVGDDAPDGAERVAEAASHALTLPFRLDLGGFSGVKHANLTRLPWGGADSEVIAYVRGPLLVNHIYNKERLVHFQARVLPPTVLQITGAVLVEAERAHFATLEPISFVYFSRSCNREVTLV